MTVHKYKYKYKHKHQFGYDGKFETLLKQDQAHRWCEQQFGECYYQRWAHYIDGFHFRNAQDYTWFLLNWS
jgi:hypothetical protein